MQNEPGEISTAGLKTSVESSRALHTDAPSSEREAEASISATVTL